MNIPSVCRTCLSRSDGDKFRPLFKKSLICSRKRRFVDLLLECIPSLQLAADDNFPKYICSRCSLLLKHFVRFRNRCLKADRELRERSESNTVIESSEQTNSLQLVKENNSDQDDDFNNGIGEERKEHPGNTQENNIKTDTVDTPTEQLVNNSVDPPNSNEKNNTNHSFVCNYCNKVLGTSKSFKCHMQLHSNLANYLCNRCGDRFKTKMAYIGHMASHDPDRYKCDVCGKSYRQAASLRNHKLSHSQEKPFSCTICGHSTSQKSSLKKHMLTHSETKSYVCDICGDHFRFSSNLIMHKRRKHTVVKDHVCSSCAKAFVSKDELLNHQMCHTDARPFECEQCQKTFNRKSSLQFHQRQKHSMRPKHACLVCGRGFGQKVSLQNHMKMHIVTD
ncbi:zinc finger protein ZFP2-like [Armigeres subalbatus]|uniref:zinc finger protein ZFP2-like n=1 Tax=Armigeres subalbatus TaxID=124917 RepID=UPI002ED28E58